MASVPPRFLALACVAALCATSCTQLSPSENTGVFAGANGQFAAGQINRAGTANTAGLLATGAPISATTNAVTAVIAKHQASVRQRQVAEARARATYARIVAQRANVPESARPAHLPKKSAGEKAATASKRLPSSKVANLYRKPSNPRIPRYLAVETEKDEHTAPGAKKAVMIWDTETQEIVGNNVYDVATTPAVGSTSRFEIFSAEYVGAGL